MKGQNGKIVKEAFYGERNCLKGRMNGLAEVLVFRIGKRRGSAHPGTDKGGVLRRMVGGVPMSQGMSSCLDHHEA